MGFFSSLFSGGASLTKDLVVDLGAFTCGHSKLGAAPDARDFFARRLKSSGVYAIANGGFEVGAKQGVLDHIYLEPGYYQGGFARHGTPVALDFQTTQARIRAEFGEPYWIDPDEDEATFFYEFAGGVVELQFQFPDNQDLGAIKLMREGELSRAEFRNIYRVTKAWPPPARP